MANTWKEGVIVTATTLTRPARTRADDEFVTFRRLGPVAKKHHTAQSQREKLAAIREKYRNANYDGVDDSAIVGRGQTESGVDAVQRGEVHLRTRR